MRLTAILSGFIAATATTAASAVLAFSVPAAAASTAHGQLSIVAGSTTKGGLPTPGPATKSLLMSPNGVAVDAKGNRYIADSNAYTVDKVTPSGRLSVFAGRPGKQGTPTAGPATARTFEFPSAVAVDSRGDVLVVDAFAATVVKINPAGHLSIFAGIPDKSGNPTNGSVATKAHLWFPSGVAIDSSGTVYIADAGANVVVKVGSTGKFTIVAGKPGKPGAAKPGVATKSQLGFPYGVAIASGGSIVIADGTGLVERVTKAGKLTILAGRPGKRGLPKAGIATRTSLWEPRAVAVDSKGNVFIADGGSVTGHGGGAYVIEKVTAAGRLTIIAGQSGKSAIPQRGLATAHPLGNPEGVALDRTGANLYIADFTGGVLERVVL